MNRAVFLDRDNTLIHNDGDLGDPAQVRLIQGAASAIASLRGLGYRIVVVSNQGGVARGKYTEKDVEAVHRRVAELVKSNSGATIDKFYFCPYHPEGTVEQFCREHPWRKPSPGMLRQAAEDLNLDLSHSWTVGDQMRDIEAGAAAGTRTILLSDSAHPPRTTNASTSTSGGAGGVTPDFVARNMIEAARLIAQHRQKIVELLPAYEGMKVVPADPPPEAPPEAPPEVLPEMPPEMSARGESSVDDGVPGETGLAENEPDAEETAAVPPPDVRRPIAPPPAPVTASRSGGPAADLPEPPTLAVAADDVEPVDRATEPAPPAEPSTAHAAGSTGPDGSRELLQQILRELKAHRAHLGDFAMSKMFAALFQMLAAGCLLYSFFHVADPVVFTQWMAGAILSQLLVITLLLVHGLK